MTTRLPNAPTAPRPTAAALACERVRRTFHGPHGEVVGLADVSFEVARGEFVVIHGASGSGKSTLLLTLGGMLRPTSGTVRVESHDLYAASPRERSAIRAEAIGFVFQLFHLVPYLTVRENILAGAPGSAGETVRERADQLIEELALGHRATHRPGTLSAGERQRAALARALVKNPRVILADEPTGNLDPANATTVFSRLARFQAEGGTVLVVTHGSDADRHATRVLRLADGRLT